MSEFDDFGQGTEYPARVVVRFRDGIRVPATTEPAVAMERAGIGPWSQLTTRFPGLSLSPVFTAVEGGRVQDLTSRAARMDPAYRPADFGAFYYVDAPPQTDLVELARSFLRWENVREAYVDQAGPDPVVNAADDPRAVDQGYLDAAPAGINARYAWTFVGGDGQGQRVIDLERGWTLNHEDITAHGAALLHGTLLDTSRAHGTSVLGQICAVDNTLGCVGIVPKIAQVNVVSYHGSTRPNAILAAIANLQFGGVLLLEAQVALNGTSLLGPIEAYDAEYEAIRLATALGIIVVEAGGNGTNNGSTPPLNMDTYTTLSGKAILNRDPANPDFRDSGAIIVTAATAAAPHTRLAWAPHGKRIDCYAWGHAINTLSSSTAGSTTAYTTGFGGTSGASPIITGAALAVQGRAEAQLGFKLGPLQMRALLSNPANGTPPAVTEATKIGVMPDLKKIFDTGLNTAPDVYLRDFVGDTGLPHGGAISASPDIILRPGAVVNPQAAFGAGSGTENSSTLGYVAEAGQQNYVYVRVLNQGGSPATNVKATVYWCPVSTLLTPDMWTLVGSTTIPSVPVGEQLTVSNAIPWPAAQIPGTGHYCFVGLVGNAADPAPNPAAFLNWDNYYRFVRENNNVTWRNFNVENNDPDVNDPSVPAGYKALPFLAPGAPDRDLPMAVEVTGKLPQGARLLLEVPVEFHQRMRGHHPVEVPVQRGRDVVLLAANPHGALNFGEMVFPAGSRSALRLLVQIPQAERDHAFQVAVRQVWEGNEVGRVTWQLQRPRPQAAPVPVPGAHASRCAQLRRAASALLAVLVVVAGVLTGTALLAAGAAALALTVGVAAHWIRSCRPSACALLGAGHAGAGGGAVGLGLLLAAGVAAPQTVAVLAASLAASAACYVAARMRGC